MKRFAAQALHTFLWWFMVGALVLTALNVVIAGVNQEPLDLVMTFAVAIEIVLIPILLWVAGRNSKGWHTALDGWENANEQVEKALGLAEAWKTAAIEERSHRIPAALLDLTKEDKLN